MKVVDERARYQPNPSDADSSMRRDQPGTIRRAASRWILRPTRSSSSKQARRVRKTLPLGSPRSFRPIARPIAILTLVAYSLTFVGVGQAVAAVPWGRAESSLRLGLDNLASKAKRRWASQILADIAPSDRDMSVVRRVASAHDSNAQTDVMLEAQEALRTLYAQRQNRRADAFANPLAPTLLQTVSLLNRLEESIASRNRPEARSLLSLIRAEEVNIESARQSVEAYAAGIAAQLDAVGAPAARARARQAAELAELNERVDALLVSLSNLKATNADAARVALEAARTFMPSSVDPGNDNEPGWQQQVVYADPVPLETATPVTASTGNPVAAAASNGPPDPDDLLETLDIQFTPELTALATSLGNDPIELYEHVRNEFEFEAYSGSLKGSQGAIETGRGNDFDLASLLIGLLRVSGHPARYVQGTTEIEADRVAAWLGLTDPAAANGILNTAGISATPIVDGGGQLILYRITRTWVEAYLPFGDYRGGGGESAWVSLDPAFKQHVVDSGIAGMLATVPFDESAYLAQRTTQLTYEYYREQVRNHLLANVPGAGLQDVPVKKRVVEERFGVLPASLPYRLVSEDRIFSESTVLDRHRVSVTLRAGGTLLTSTLTVPEVALDRITLSYQPAPEDQATVDSFGGLAQTPCSIVDVIPRLAVDGALVQAGTQVAYCTPVFLDIGVQIPGQAGVIETLTHDGLGAGEPLAIGLEAHQTSDAMLARLAQDALDAHAAELAGNGDPEELIGSFLAFSITRHHHRVKQGEEVLDALTGHHTVRQLFEGVAKADANLNFTVGNMFAVTPGELVVDVLRQTVGQFGIDGDDTQQVSLFRLNGFNGSAQEHATWEEIVGVESVSTIKSLQRANETANPVLTFAPGTSGAAIRAALNQPISVEDLVVSEVASGSTVEVPTSPTPINSWNGTGILVSTAAGGVSYLISGGLLGGSTAAPEQNAVRLLEQQEARDGFQKAVDRGVRLARFAAEHPTELDSVRNRPLRTALSSLLERYSALEATEKIVPAKAGYGFLVRDASNESIPENERDSFLVDPYAGGAVTIIVFADGTVLIVATGGSGTGPGTATSGDPVNIANGNLIVQDVDIDIPSLGPDLLFSRTYNANLDRVGALGRGWVHPFEMSLGVDGQGNVDLIANDGAVYTFVPDVTPGTFTSPPGVPLTLVETPQRYEITMREGSRFHFGLDGVLDELLDRNGNATTLTYDLSLRLTSVSGSGGRSLTMGYDGSDQISSVTDHTGRTWTYDYDGNDNLDQVTYPEPTPGVVLSRSYGYEAADPVLHKLNSVTDFRGNQSQFRYYANGRVFQEIDRAGAVQTLVYDDFSNRTRVINPRGGETEYLYDDMGRMIGRMDPNDALTRFEYDADGNRSKKIDALGRETIFGYDANRNLTSIVRGAATMTMVYDPVSNRLESVTDGRGQTNSYGYDANGNRTRITGASGGETIFTFDAEGRELTMRDADMNLTTYVRNENGELLSATDQQGNVYSFTYDALGRTRSARDSDGAFTLYGVDVLGRLTSVTDPMGRVETTAHDENGNVTTSTSFAGRVTTNTYDANDRVLTTTNAVGGTSHFEYNSTGELAASTDAGGTRTEYDYDLAGRLEAVRIVGGERRFVYDAVGNVIEEINARGESILYEYDAVDQMVMRDAAGDLATFSYDANGNMLTATNAATTVAMTYDMSGRLETISDSLTARQLTYDYDLRGNRTLLREGGRDITYQYDSIDLLDRIEDDGTLVADFTYDDARRRIRTDFGNGSSTSFDYRSDGRLTRMASQDSLGATMVFDSYSYDADGTRLSDTTEGGIREYGVDPLRRLASITESGASNLISYDDAWNVLDNGVSQFAYNDRSQLIQADGPTVRNFEHDLDGNVDRIVDDGVETVLAYDALGQLTQATVDGVVTNYRYDALGRRIEKQTGSAIERVVWDNTQPFLFLNGTNTETARVLHGPGLDEHLKLDTPTADYYYHRDVIGSVRALSDESGNLAHQFRYSAFGELLTGDPGPAANPFLYVGRQFDGETGFYFFRARYYDPGSGRFLQADPFPGIPQVPGTFNRYVYAANNPALFVDPTGEIIPLFFAAVAVGALVGGTVSGTVSAATGGGGSFSEVAADFGSGFVTGAVGGGVGTAVAFIPGAGPVAAGAAGSFAGSLTERGMGGTLGDPGTASGLVADTLLGGALGPLGNRLSPSLIKPGTFKPNLFSPRDLSFYRSLLDGQNVNSTKTLLDTILGNAVGDTIGQVADGSGLRDLWQDITGEAFDNIAEALK